MPIIGHLRNENDALWESTVKHPFVNELREGILPLEKFRRYLVQDYLFVRDLIKVTSLAISKAPDMESARKLGNFLQALLTSEDSLFIGAFEELDVDKSEYESATPLPTTKAFGDFLVRLAHEGTFVEILTALYVTEGTYLDWASRLIQQGKRPQNEMYCQWIDIHSPEALGGFVAWLKSQVDGRQAGTKMTRLSEIFKTALRYECLFWDMAYNGEDWPSG